jgi:5-amino-6-(5-phosphoribosylamino)uracil reductase
MAQKSFKSFSNLAISLDGKIADPAMPEKMLGTALDRRMMKVIRAKADVVIFGATTLRASRCSIKNLVNVVVSASGNLEPDLPFWNDPKVIRFVFTTAEGYARAVESSRGRAFVVLAGQAEIDPSLIIKRLLESGLSRILVEGGGETMALFFNHSLIQEMYVTLTPRIIGGRDAPTLVGGGSVLDPWKSLKLLKIKRVGDELYLHYKVKSAQTKI